MADSDSAPAPRRPLDERALAQVLARLRRAPSAPWLHGEAARRMADRLAAIRVQPALVLDWWAGLSASRELLERCYPKARVVAVEPAP
ncbi:MAG: biotin synthase, partial [Burkholderiales bacterium]|nr:biotin synthase [Burkholderiales bacterium]